MPAGGKLRPDAAGGCGGGTAGGWRHIAVGCWGTAAAGGSIGKIRIWWVSRWWMTRPPTPGLGIVSASRHRTDARPSWSWALAPLCYINMNNIYGNLHCNTGSQTR